MMNSRENKVLSVSGCCQLIDKTNTKIQGDGGSHSLIFNFFSYATCVRSSVRHLLSFCYAG